MIKDTHLIETCLSSETVFDGKLLKIKRDTVALPNGETAIREYNEHPGAVMMIPVLEDGRYVMERQFRYPLRQVFLEFPAGKIDPGENPEATAHRELLEETGYKAERLEYLTTIHPIISYSTERIVLYAAYGLTKHVQQLDDNEFLEVITMSPNDLMARIANGEVTDVKTIIGAFWLNQSNRT